VSRCRALLILVGIVSTSFVALAPAPAEAAPNDLQLLDQNFNVAADGALTVTVALPPAFANTDLSSAIIDVTVAQRVDKREDLAPIISGALSRPDDTVALSAPCCLGPEPGQLTFSVPLETAEVRPDALSIPRTGLYPVTIALQSDGKVVAKVLTFLNRLPAVDELGVDTDKMAVAVAIGTHSAVHLDSKGVTSLDNASTVTEMTALADTLDALDANDIPATVRVAPAVLNGLQQLNQPLFARLIASLQQHQVVAEPQWPIDPSAAASAGQDLLYTAWLRDGQDRLGSLGLGPTNISRSTFFVDQPIGPDGATLRRNLGASLMVMTQPIYNELDGSIKVFSQYKGELVGADLPNNTTLDVAVVDDGISKLLANPLDTPELTRIYAVAHLLALRQGIEIFGDSVSQRAVVIGTGDLGVPDAALIGTITALIAGTPGLKLAALDDLALRTDRLVIEGEEKPVTLPEVDGAALERRIFTQATLNNEIDGVASMLPDGDDQPRGWRDLTDLLPTSALDDNDAAAMASTVEFELAQVRGAVQVPPAFTVNLTGRRSTVRVRLVNNSDVPLQIRVQLTSPSGKLVFANNPQPVSLPPGAPTLIAIPVQARSNGTSPVSLDIFTPNDVKLGDTVPLTFRVKALGVGNLLTIALFGLVLLWWLLHLRSSRRNRRQAAPATLPDS
jgi:hypothetical protein